MDGQYRGTFDQSQYIGPVRRIIRFEGFVTVEIKSAFVEGEIGYVNLANGGIKFARRVPRDEVDSWKSRGWVDDVGEAPLLIMAQAPAEAQTSAACDQHLSAIMIQTRWRTYRTRELWNRWQSLLCINGFAKLNPPADFIRATPLN